MHIKIRQFKRNKKIKRKRLTKQRISITIKATKQQREKSRRTVQWEGKWIVKGKKNRRLYSEASNYSSIGLPDDEKVW